MYKCTYKCIDLLVHNKIPYSVTIVQSIDVYWPVQMVTSKVTGVRGTWLPPTNWVTIIFLNGISTPNSTLQVAMALFLVCTALLLVSGIAVFSYMNFVSDSKRLEDYHILKI